MTPMELQGICPSDVVVMRDHFAAQGWNRDQHVFHYAQDSDRWELFRIVGLAIESQTAKVTRVLVYDMMDGWIAP